ncbi:hypothetical protein [Alkalihalobacillus sp. TS-13]|uniref:hypothetical protein n=1 Tax=Alkalihalobacillus sp. TS-13 TaxID=2842455 RepID=UPI001C88501F|nr:hypothetical protein [Alkalihalobacillus sp. TS-13]
MSRNNFAVVKEKLDIALEDWEEMQKTTGDEGAEWAERFERHFYEMIEAVKYWYHSLETKPANYEKFESMAEMEEIQEQLPGPLQLNFITELEDIYDGLEKKSSD